MIPNTITHHHVIAAMEQLGPNEINWPPKRRLKDYAVIHPDPARAWRMPPKLVLSVAAAIATGQELMSKDFYGGDEANGYLEGLGFTVIKLREI